MADKIVSTEWIGVGIDSGGGFDFWVRGQNDHRGEGELSIWTENCC